MADVYGVRIIPDDGGKAIILDASMRYASSLGSARLTHTVAAPTMKALPAGARPLIVPRNLVNFEDSNNAAGPAIAYVRSMQYAGNRLTFDSRSISPGGGYKMACGNVDVFSVAGAADPSVTYGVNIRNGSDFMQIGDVSYCGFVTYRAVITVSGAWTIPSSITSLGSYIVFARWSNTSVPLFLDRDTNTIRTYTAFGNIDGSQQGGTVSNIQIVIVSCGFSPGLPASGYGMVIRNAAGQITYSSKYPPVMWPDAYYNFAAYENFDGSNGEVLSWVNPTGSVSQPMVPLCSIGTQTGDYNRSTDGFTFRKALYAGMKMNGNAVSTARAKTTGWECAKYDYPKAVQAGCQLPCIDASYYF